MEAVFERLEGVIDVVSGYSGGKADTAHYEVVGSGRTGHAESVRITYDAARISYRDRGGAAAGVLPGRRLPPELPGSAPHLQNLIYISSTGVGELI